MKNFNAKSHWNKSHDAQPKDKEPSNYAIEKEKLFPRSSVVCDLGGGGGTDTFYFLKNGHTVFLFDVSDSALQSANEKAKELGISDKLTTTQFDLAKDKNPGDSNLFDVVYSRLALHYFESKKMIDIFNDIYRTLKPNGTAYIAVKSPDDKREMEFLKSNSTEIEPGVFEDSEGMIKTRFSKDDYMNILQKTSIPTVNFKVGGFKEKLGVQKDYTKSKADEFLYIEIVIKK